MTYKNFYDFTKNFLDRKAAAWGVTDLKKYYKPTDSQMDWYSRLPNSDIAKCFAQFIFHTQNATMISNIVKFEENFDFLKKFTKNFSPKKFYNTYVKPYPTDEARINNIVNKIRYNDTTNEGLVWDSTKSKEENKDKIAKRFATALVRGSTYLKDFSTKKALVNDLLKHHTTSKYKGVVDENNKLINHFMNKIGKGAGFSVALTCDFLKELDEKFNFLAKPDIHIKDVLVAFKGKKKGYYNGESKNKECLRDFQKIVKEVNKTMPKNGQITVYQLDRMIWLICSGKFFLDNVGLEKRHYIAGLK